MPDCFMQKDILLKITADLASLLVCPKFLSTPVRVRGRARAGQLSFTVALSAVAHPLHMDHGCHVA
jgi:hypothetical protein